MVKGTFPIFYFSGTGNTWWVSQQIADALQEQGLQAQVYSIEQIEPNAAGELIKVAAGAGFGFPMYGSDVPRCFKDWFEKLPAQKEKKQTLGFVTQGLWSGTGCNFLEDDFKEKGLIFQWTLEFNMPNNICLPAFPFFPYQSDMKEFKPILEKRIDDIKALSVKIVDGARYRQNNDTFSRASAWIQRGPFRLMHDPGRTLWSVDSESCLGENCSRCVNICPVGNISMENRTAVHTESCIYCMRCFNYCPTHAIRYLGASNKKLEKKPPFRGPVPEFKPELICGKDSEKH